jgi:hypothetical protein
MASRFKSPAARAKRKARTLPFPVEFRLRIVKLLPQAGVGVSLDQGGGGRGSGLGRQTGHHAGVLADRSPAVAGYEQTDQDREDGKSVTPFLF